MRYSIFLFGFIFISVASVNAQRDTSRPVTIEITSNYKPVLKSLSKINFSGTQLLQDTNRIVAPYKVPTQHVYYAYQPTSVKAVALDVDTSFELGGRNFVKAGFGNYATPYLKAGIAFGNDPNLIANVYADYISSKGSIKNQDYSLMNVKGAASYFAKGHELYASLGFSSRGYHLYGYDHELYDFSKKDVKQRFNEVDIRSGLKNTTANKFGIEYDPRIRINFFSLADGMSESNFVLDIPAEKKFGDRLSVAAGFNADFTRYATKGNVADTQFNNSLVSLRLAGKYYRNNLMINVGAAPVWDNSRLYWLPNLYFEARLADNLLMLQGGWIGHINKNTMRDLSAANPYIQPLQERFNTREIEFYGGVKATLGSHFNFGGKVSWVTYYNYAMFLNDTLLPVHSFMVGKETKMNNFRIHGNVSYIFQEGLELTGAFTLNGYTNREVYSRAWNATPLEINASARYQLLKPLLLKAEFYSFAPSKILDAEKGERAGMGGTDLSMGAEYRINKQFSAWLDVNNIFGKKYERWPMYPVYGLNLLGGIIVHF